MNDRPRTYVTDHLAIRVADISRAVKFYSAAFGAVVLTEPFVVDGALAQGMTGEPAGVSFRMCQVGFENGVMELAEFSSPAEETTRIPAQSLNILHIGLQVDDVELAIERVEAEGGRVVVPLTSWGSAKLCFCTDPDGTVLELADTSIHELLVHTRSSQRR
jgi:catechol 2,3-dioxygenase-like lactoylglutathione lyase family enzyme